MRAPFLKFLIWAVFLFPFLCCQGESPEWFRLDKYKGAMSKAEFERLLKNVYVPREKWRMNWIELGQDAVKIRKQGGKDEWYVMPFFNPDGNATTLPPEEYWRSGRKLRSTSTVKPLSGYRIALDPGHLGGRYSRMEGRHFEIGEHRPVKEGDLTLQVAKRLSKNLRALGAEVFLLRTSAKPTTKERPKTLREEGRAWQKRIDGESPPDRNKRDQRKIEKRRAEILFFRKEEISARARLVNEEIKPDLVVCIHLNAAAWPDPDNHELVERNDFHVLTNGAYMGGEVAVDEQRLQMMVKLLSRSHREELSLAESMAACFSRATGLPAFSYKGPNAVKIGETPGVWGRNLLANRLYQCPVVFLEPYVANSKEVFARIAAGDYKGVKKVAGKLRVSLVEEYVDAVVAGLVLHAGNHSP